MTVAERAPKTVAAQDWTESLLHGWLSEVNWHEGTARLYDVDGGYLRLHFPGELAERMLRLATQFVEVRGRGRCNAAGAWTKIRVDSVEPQRSWSEPFDLASLRDNPSVKPFDPDAVITASEPFDVDEFLRTIHDARDA